MTNSTGTLAPERLHADRIAPVLFSPPAPDGEADERFACFGGECAVLVRGSGPAGGAAGAAARVRRRMLEWHDQFSRFQSGSELSRLNHDQRSTVPVSPMMVRFVEAALSAAQTSGGLVDPTLLGEVERAGYDDDFAGVPLPLSNALAMAGHRHAAGPEPSERWRQLSVDAAGGTVSRPPGLLLDSGGIAKGLFADVVSSVLCRHASFAVNLAGDLRFGGARGLTRPVQVTDPFDDSILHVFELVRGAAATSGISRRSWLDANGEVAHHLLDPASGRPAFTGVVQATALAPTALEAEVLAKSAVLSGPEQAAACLRHGGLVVRDDGTHEVIEPPAPYVPRRVAALAGTRS